MANASNFDFVTPTWPQLGHESIRAERYAIADPRTSVFYARRAVEAVVDWLYTVDGTLNFPYKDDLASRLFEPTFVNLVGHGIQAKMNLIRKQGNNAVHQAGAFTDRDSLPIVRELFYVMLWLATHYAPSDDQRPPAGIPFNATAIPRPQPGAAARTAAQLKQLNAELEQKDVENARLNAENAELMTRLAEWQAATATIKERNAAIADTTDYREDETRDLFIDVLLREAGWALTDTRDIEYPVTGMPNDGGNGRVDYVLWGDDGKPLGLVEAKRTKRDARVGGHQAKLYADALERESGQRPVIFYSNGYEHWIWDDTEYPPRQVQGFYTKDQLELLVQRRRARKPLASLQINTAIIERYYQQRAVRKVAESVDRDKQRRALLVMATGSGKTRTVIGLTDLLFRANRAKRVLFLADRIALVNQATNAFKQHLPDAAPVNLLTEKDTEGRVYLSTYPTIMGLIDSGGDDLRRFGPGYFDLIVIDEAHRSVYQKYGSIFRYFDALLVGLTATPKDDVDHNTYGLFNLEDGIPTDSYELADAIAEGYLVPPIGTSISTDFVRKGIRYDDLSPDEKDQWDLLDWEDGVVPVEIGATAVNKWLFNRDTVDKVLATLMTDGRKVAGGDRLGKTIIFAKSNAHAQFIADRFNASYPEYAGAFAQVITHQTEYAQNLIDTFSQTDKLPQIAISVDMLDTGIDVPDVVNLVLFKEVHSKTKYWQMVGRGTRLRPDLYGPGESKADFVIFDVCQNIEFFNQELPPDKSSVSEPLGQRLFKARLSLKRALDAQPASASAELRSALTERLHKHVSGMSLDNMLVRPHRRAVERLVDANRWSSLDEGDYAALADELSGLPSATQLLDTDEKAKRFDLLALTVQLRVLGEGTGAVAARASIQEIADALSEQKAIPKVAAQLELIAAVAGDDWWDGVTVDMLELMRLRLRDLARLIDPTRQTIIFTDFIDSDVSVEHTGITVAQQGMDRQRFREKALAFLRAHENDLAIQKLRRGKQLTPADLQQLETIMLASGEFNREDIDRAAEESHGLGVFVRSLLGLDREAASDLLGEFISDTTLSANQIAFVNLIVEQLTHNGTIDLELLYQDPFIGYAPTGPENLFTGAQVTSLFMALRKVNASAVAS